MIYDKTGRKMEHGDLFRIPHFKDRRRRQRWLYFFLEHRPELKTQWWGVSIRGGWNEHHFPLDNSYQCEVLDVILKEDPKVCIFDYYNRPINHSVRKFKEGWKIKEVDKLPDKPDEYIIYKIGDKLYLPNYKFTGPDLWEVEYPLKWLEYENENIDLEKVNEQFRRT